jgi:fumarylacetoacetate (FAA) hydrolase family protein
VARRGDDLVDITRYGPTVSALLERPDVVDIVRDASGRRWALDRVVEGSLARDPHVPHLLAPIDLQVIKAAGVTFVRSLLERVIEEAARGEPGQAEHIRASVLGTAAGGLADIVPGSPQARRLRDELTAQGLWSAYLEVGIGPDPEIFTKAPVLSAVGHGAAVGVLSRSRWNNPEPEVVLVATSAGRAVGVTLGNDVNLRDFEGRSALLLGVAKDNNASCAIGPFVRLFDDGFTFEDARRLEVRLQVHGDDGFTLDDSSSLSEMSRDPADLLRATYGPHHRYPDGFVLFTGTMFAPTVDRGAAGEGFTHHRGDRVTISCPDIGVLTNTVTTSEEARAWDFGIGRLMGNLAHRGLLLGSQDLPDPVDSVGVSGS